MRWTPIIVLALASVSAAQPSQTSTPPPGVDISAKDGDRILVDDDARIEIIRRRQATIRTIYSRTERVLIVLVDYSKPGAFPDGIVDWAFNFYNVEGTWPLGPRWEALTGIYQFQAESSRQTGLAIETPRGLVRLVTKGHRETLAPPADLAVLSYSGAANGPRHNVSFAEAEKMQLSDFVRSKTSGATVGTTMTPDGRTGTSSLEARIRKGDSTGPPTQTARPPVAPPYPDAMRQANRRPPPPAGQEIPARDGDRVIIDDDARVQIVRRRQATVRAIFNVEQRALIVLADYATAGELPDGKVDWVANFYDLEGAWPLPELWEAQTTLLQLEGDPPPDRGYALSTPVGLVRLAPGLAGSTPDPGVAAFLIFRGGSFGGGRGMTFDEAEKAQLAEVVRRNKAR